MSLQDLINIGNYEEALQLVSFKIGSEEFGVNILQVQEINRPTQITHVPNIPDFIEGVINLRGKIIPVVNLRKKFGLGEKEYDKNTRVIVVELNNKIVGFIVDSVSEVLRISKKVVEPPPEIISSGVDTEYITGIAKLEERLLILLDLEKVLSVEERESLKEVHAKTDEN
ncbi:MAG: chemotaxis protein CheW [Candidatus Kryptonium sp.]